MLAKRKNKTDTAKQRSSAMARFENILTPAREFLYELSLFTGAMSGWNPMSIGEYEDRLNAQKLRERQERLRYLKRRKWIETKQIGEKLMMRLTAKGWQQILRDQIRCTKTICKGNSCILVVFDIPESQRHVRDTLRWILSECNFEMLQKSVWFTKRDVLEPLCALLQGAKLERWVRIVVGSELRQPFLSNVTSRFQAWQKSHAKPNQSLAISVAAHPSRS